MSTLHILLLTFWVVPASLASAWTLLTAVFAWTRPLNMRMPRITRGNLLLMIHNPKDDFLYQRPSLGLALGIIALGLIPLVAFLYLAFVAWIVGNVYFDKLRGKHVACNAH